MMNFVCEVTKDGRVCECGCTKFKMYEVDEFGFKLICVDCGKALPTGK